MMAIGAVTALIFAAGSLATSFLLQMFFGAALLLLASGAAMRRISAKKDALSGAANGEVRKAHKALESLRDALEKSQADCDSIQDMWQFHRCVDEATQQPVRDFLQHRQSLLDACGFGPFAELMIRFARVERAINRALSASADGVDNEARTCLQQAGLRMENCMASWRNNEAARLSAPRH